MNEHQDRIQRERDHWDHVIPTANEVVAQYRQGPDPNVKAMLDAVNPSPGRHVVDFACGGGVTSLWLAARGTQVTGIDLSPQSIMVAREAASIIGLDVSFRVADLEELEFLGGYDGMIGRYALHHLDVAKIAPAMARAIKPGATAAFVETMAFNPVLRFARDHLTGRYGIPRFGTLDEHPLVRSDLIALEKAFGQLEVRADLYEFLRLFDRQVLRFRYPRATKLVERLDQGLARLPKIKEWSYHQVVILHRTV